MTSFQQLRELARSADLEGDISEFGDVSLRETWVSAISSHATMNGTLLPDGFFCESYEEDTQANQETKVQE